jgi:phosphohistidine phosphatase
MKRLFLLRHAKSSWDDPQMDDRDRPLNARGMRDAPRMAAYMLAKGYKPDVALCSPAVRTRETIEAATPVIGEFPISYPETLYLAESETVRALVADLDNAYEAALVVGHNPGIGTLASQITDFESLEEAHHVNKFPTAALAVFETDADDWQTALSGRLKLIDFMTPKALP